MRESGIFIDGNYNSTLIAELVNRASNVDHPDANFIVDVYPPSGSDNKLFVSFYSGTGNVDPVTAITAQAILEEYPELSVQTFDGVGNPIPF